MSKLERLQAFLKELNKLSNKYDLWIQPEVFKKGIAIYDCKQEDTVAHRLDHNCEEYFCEVSDYD